MVDINNGDKAKTESFIEIRESDFGWESLGSIENRRKSQIIKEIYALRDINDERLQELQAEWDSLIDNDVETSIENQYKSAIETYHQRKESIAKALEIKRDLVAKAQALSNSKDWRKTSELLKQYQQQWREAGYAGLKENDTLWEAFSKANDIFFENRNKFYEELNVIQAEAKKNKEALIEEAEKLADSTDWKETSARLRELMEAWKQTAFAGRIADKELWERFNAARQKFYQRQNEHFDQINAERDKVKAVKESLIEKAKALLMTDDLGVNKEAMDQLLEDWKQAGSAGYKVDQALWEDFNGVRNDFYTQLRATESQSRYQKQQYVLEQTQTLTQKIETLTEANEGLRNKIEALKVRLEAEQAANADTTSLQAEITELEGFVEKNSADIEAYETELNNLRK